MLRTNLRQGTQAYEYHVRLVGRAVYIPQTFGCCFHFLPGTYHFDDVAGIYYRLCLDEVTTLITPGSTIDVVVTEYGIAVNPRRPEIAERLKAAGLKIVDIHDLKDLALKSIGVPDPLPFGDKVVGVVMNRDGSVMDVIMNIED